MFMSRKKNNLHEKKEITRSNSVTDFVRKSMILVLF